MDPMIILLVGVILLIVLIMVLRLNAFIALISVAILVSLLAPGEFTEKIGRVASAFGSVMGGIGIVIALAAVIGKCLMESGAADRIVRSLLKAFGVKQAAAALLGSGFILAIPVFFDTVFYLLVPLARSLARRTQKNYLLFITAICAGGALTHTLVPPTPGPLFMAEAFGIDLGKMILMGVLVALPAAVLSLIVCKTMDSKLDIPMRPYGDEVEPEPIEDDKLPPLWLSLLPVVLPVLLIAGNTLSKTLGASETVIGTMSILGNPNLALLLSTVIAMYLLISKRALSFDELGSKVEKALMSGGVIILVTAGGGAFGAMLREAGLQESVRGWIDTGGDSVGIVILLTAFGVAAVLKFAQGSSTVAMITGASMFSAMNFSGDMLGYDIVYLATAIGSGSLVGSWMNDSGFWIYTRMSVLTEGESLKTWTVLLAFLGITSMIVTLLLAILLPMT